MGDTKLMASVSESSLSRRSMRLSIDANLKHLEYSPMKRAHVVLPKISNSQQLSLFKLLAVHANNSIININVPTTLIRIEDSNYPYLIQSNKNGTVMSRLCLEQEFFLLSPEKISQDIPMYCYKIPNTDTIFLYSKESAEEVWRQSTEPICMMQHFTACYTKNAAITRVYWKLGAKSQHFVIINRENPKCNSSVSIKKTQTPTINRKKRSMTMIGDFKWSDLISKTSKSINNPFNVIPLAKPTKKEKKKFPRISETNESRFLGLLESPKGFDSLPSNEDCLNSIVNTKVPDSFFVIEENTKVIEIESMVHQIIAFLNGNYFKGSELKEIIIDFIQDRRKKWLLLDCREYSAFSRSPSECLIKKRTELEPLSKRRTMSFGGTQKIVNPEPIIDGIPIDDQRETTDEDQSKSASESPKLYRSSQNIIETEFMDRFNKVNQKLDQIIKLQPQNVRTMNLKEQSIKAYQNRFYVKNQNLELTEIEQEDSESSEMSKTQCPYKSTEANSLWNDKSNEYINRCFLDIIGKIDEMNMNTELLRIKRRNLVKKYGGEEFWYQFINQLYDQVMVHESLKKYFKNTNFVMIIGGMLKLFNGCATLEFRRKIKAAHEFLGITEKDFFLYTTIFEDTLKAFKIEPEDRQSIMNQIKSMKCLICRKSFP